MPLKRVSGSGVSLQCTHVAEGHVGAALCLAACPGGSVVYSAGVDRTIRAWDMSAGGEAWRGAAGGAATALAAPARCTLLAAAAAAVRLLDTRVRAPVATLWSSGAMGPSGGPRGETAISAITLGAPHALFTAAGDKLRLWDLRMLECVWSVWSGHAAPVMCLAADSRRLVTGSKDHYVRVLDLQTNPSGGCDAGGRRLLEPPHYDGVQALALTDDALYTASRDSSIKRWSLHDYSLTHSTMGAHKGWVTGLAGGGGGGGGAGGGLASAGRDGALRLWSPALRARAAAPGAAAAALAARDRALYTAGTGGDVRAWRIVYES